MAQPAAAADPSRDFALLQQSVVRSGGRNRRALLWLLGLLGLLLGLVATLLLYLNNFEAEESARRRAADAQWLAQSVQFHFRRLEDDLLVLARQAVLQRSQPTATAPTGPVLQGGLLWREPGVVLSSGWMAADLHRTASPGPQRWQTDLAAHPDNAQALTLMQTTTQGLRRSAYAGLMLHPDGAPGDVLWLAVPFFDRGAFVGNYLAAISLQRALAALVPAWFAQDHRIALLAEAQAGLADPLAADNTSYRVALNLPGSDLAVQVIQTQATPATVPRIFFLVALLFLLGMLVALYALRRDIVKRQQVQALLQAQVALRTAMENSVTTGLRAWNLQGCILYVNAAFTRMVGYSSAELIGRSMPFPYWPPEQHEALTQVHANLMTGGTGGRGVEVQFAHRDGHLTRPRCTPQAACKLAG